MSHVDFAYDVVGMCGFAGAGKDTAAQALLDTGAWKRVALADPLRTAMLAMDPYVLIDKDHPLVVQHFNDAHIVGEDVLERMTAIVRLVGWDAAKQVPEIRRLLQTYGTDAGRDVFGENCWTDLARQRILQNARGGFKSVVTDVRFESESKMVHELGGIVVNILRPGVGPVNSHSSDAGIESYDKIIYNNSSIADLHQKVLGVVSYSKNDHLIRCRSCDHEWRALAESEAANTPCAICGGLAGECVS